METVQFTPHKYSHIIRDICHHRPCLCIKKSNKFQCPTVEILLKKSEMTHSGNGFRNSHVNYAISVVKRVNIETTQNIVCTDK